jgi:hypothetical protein
MRLSCSTVPSGQQVPISVNRTWITDRQTSLFKVGQGVQSCWQLIHPRAVYTCLQAGSGGQKPYVAAKPFHRCYTAYLCPGHNLAGFRQTLL